MSVFGDRLKLLREEAGLSQEDLAAKLNIGRTTLTNYETGLRRPKLDTMDAILDYFNVTLDWMDGKSETRNPYDFQGIYDLGYAAGKAETELSEEETKLIDLYRDLSEFDKDFIQTMIEKLSTRPSSRIPNEAVPYRTMTLYAGRPSAGSGNYLPDAMSLYHSEIQVPDTPETEKADFILEVDGRSMEPKLKDGDRILVHRQDAVQQGEIGVFLVNDEVVVKQCRDGYLHSLNPAYPDISLQESDTVRCFGKVIGKL